MPSLAQSNPMLARGVPQIRDKLLYVRSDDGFAAIRNQQLRRELTGANIAKDGMLSAGVKAALVTLTSRTSAFALR